MAFTLCRNVSLNKLSHARRLSSQDVILCRGGCLKCQSQTRCALLHPLLHTDACTHGFFLFFFFLLFFFYNVPLSNSAKVQCSIAELCRAVLCVFNVCAKHAGAHCDAVVQRDNARAALRQGIFMAGSDLQHSHSHYSVCLSRPSPLSLPLCVFLFIFICSLALPFSLFLAAFSAL